MKKPLLKMSGTPEERQARARKRQRNLVAKHAHGYNKAATYRDRSKPQRRQKHAAIDLSDALESPSLND